MQERLHRTETKLTPTVELDREKNIYKIVGKSFPEDVLLFYNPIREWISEYSKTPNEYTEFVFFLEYFNSATARIIIKILLTLEEILNNGGEVKVLWVYKKGDDIMKERGEEIKSVVLLPFEIVENE